MYINHSLSRVFLKHGGQKEAKRQKVEKLTKTSTQCALLHNLSIIPFAITLLQQETAESFAFESSKLELI